MPVFRRPFSSASFRRGKRKARRTKKLAGSRNPERQANSQAILRSPQAIREVVDSAREKKTEEEKTKEEEEEREREKE